MNLIGLGVILAIVGAVLWGVGVLPALGWILLVVGVIVLLVGVVLHYTAGRSAP